MLELLTYLLKGILGKEKFEIKESREDGRDNYTVQVKDENKGILIGKGGRMIGSLRNILKIKATLDKTAVNLQIEE